jgi:hypothetical protein
MTTVRAVTKVALEPGQRYVVDAERGLETVDEDAVIQRVERGRQVE